MKHATSLGISILELLMVITVVVTVALLTTINLENYRKSALLANTSRDILTTLESAKSKTLAGDAGLFYKVRFTSSNYQLLDEDDSLILRTPIDPALEIVPPVGDIYFAKVTGKSNGGEVLVRVKNGSQQKIVNVSTLGIVSEQ